ncbi:hypothetical protein HYH02_004686 [Chlamydomonas schloesseri]|uniref:Protein kinase domain-containing protein n=1 Tax=Chlamydomonas schloesseri TaxID=2026947 RepID=A0A835WND1_9CHLO|nr:hypothetical protein HYH02_004686 [Chlamydomonas schloesseri]|eukprot:KAG2450852.1 hypothetical protein HYH02_004686 [Chlamydomonas schloesseri]
MFLCLGFGRSRSKAAALAKAKAEVERAGHAQPQPQLVAVAVPVHVGGAATAAAGVAAPPAQPAASSYGDTEAGGRSAAVAVPPAALVGRPHQGSAGSAAGAEVAVSAAAPVAAAAVGMTAAAAAAAADTAAPSPGPPPSFPQIRVATTRPLATALANLRDLGPRARAMTPRTLAGLARDIAGGGGDGDGGDGDGADVDTKDSRSSKDTNGGDSYRSGTTGTAGGGGSLGRARPASKSSAVQQLDEHGVESGSGGTGKGSGKGPRYMLDSGGHLAPAEHGLSASVPHCSGSATGGSIGGGGGGGSIGNGSGTCRGKRYSSGSGVSRITSGSGSTRGGGAERRLQAIAAGGLEDVAEAASEAADAAAGTAGPKARSFAATGSTANTDTPREHTREGSDDLLPPSAAVTRAAAGAASSVASAPTATPASAAGPVAPPARPARVRLAAPPSAVVAASSAAGRSGTSEVDGDEDEWRGADQGVFTAAPHEVAVDVTPVPLLPRGSHPCRPPPPPPPEAAAATAPAAAAGGAGAQEVRLLPVIRGSGTYGKVVEGMYGDQRVAVKVLSGMAAAPAAAAGGGTLSASAAELAAAAVRRQRRAFEQEAQILERCHHPHVVRLLAYNLRAPRPVLVLELTDTSLARLIRPAGGTLGRLLPLRAVISIAADIARALEFIHPAIVHRDLKPANVLVNHPDSDRPIAKLTDFGLAKVRAVDAISAQQLQEQRPHPAPPPRHPHPSLLHNHPHHPNTAHVGDHAEVGTPAYMSPETFDPDTTIISDRTDIYSLGVIIWELLTGCVPWAGFNAMQIAFAVTIMQERLPVAGLLDETAPPGTGGATRCPPALRQLMLSCWEHEPARRPSAAEVLRQLAVIEQCLERQEAQQRAQQALWAASRRSSSISVSVSASASAYGSATYAARAGAAGHAESRGRGAAGSAGEAYLSAPGGLRGGQVRGAAAAAGAAAAETAPPQPRSQAQPHAHHHNQGRALQPHSELRDERTGYGAAGASSGPGVRAQQPQAAALQLPPAALVPGLAAGAELPLPPPPDTPYGADDFEIVML